MDTKKTLAALAALSVTVPDHVSAPVRKEVMRCEHCSGQLRKASRFVKGKSRTIWRCGKCGAEGKPSGGSRLHRFEDGTVVFDEWHKL
jgi:ribosomal protein L37AE/L43A